MIQNYLKDKDVNVSHTLTARKYIVDVVGDLPVILLELQPTGGSFEVKKAYIYGNSQILAQHDDDTTDPRYFYLHDRLGSVRLIVDTSGVVKNCYTYNPFGELFASETTENVLNPFKFSGQFFDNEIGQYHLRARQYDPYISRFTSRDPADGKFEEPMSFHRYLYCFNNPINMIDPLGLDAYLFFDPKGKEGFLEPQGHVTVGVDNRKGGIITRYAANGRLNPIDTRNSLKEAVNWYTSGDDIYVTFKNRVDEKGISSDSRIRAYINYDRKPFLNPYPYCSTYAKAALASGGYDMGFGAGVSPVDLMAAAIERAAFGSIFRGRDEDIEVSDKAVYWYYRTIDWMDDYVGI